MYQLLTLPYQFLSAAILSRFTVRVHSRIVEKGRSWARLWYLLRGFDRRGSGYLRLSVGTISELLGAASSSIYQWLREGKKEKAFRWWKVQRGNLRVAIGGLFAVCRSLGLSPDLSDLEISSRKKFNKAQGLLANFRCKSGFAPWGVTASIPLFHLETLQTFRAAATAATTQRLQQLSRFAAWRALPAPIRNPIDPQTGKTKTFHLPQPDDFFNMSQQDGSGFSDDSASGNSKRPPCCIHIGKKRAWVSKGFTPFGTSQLAIAQERNVSVRTVRRHLNLLQVERRQIVQSKSEYRLAAETINHDAGKCEMADNYALYAHGDDYWLSETTLGGTHIHKVATVGFSHIQSRFFAYGGSDSAPKIWLYRNNLYRSTVKLQTMSAGRARYRRDCKAESMLQKSQVAGRTTLCNNVDFSLGIFEGRTHSHAEKDGHFS